MDKIVSALPNAQFDGIATIAEAGLRGMITLRGDLGTDASQDALRLTTGLSVPGQRLCVSKGDMAAAWMSPDELLVMTPYEIAVEIEAKLTEALAGQHALAVNVSDARAVFEISGPAAREVLAKLAPVDLAADAFKSDMFRRTRLAQTPAAFWLRADGTFELICFRSVAGYVFDLLSTSARPDAEVGMFNGSR